MKNQTDKEKDIARRVELMESIFGVLKDCDLTLEEAQKLRFKERYGIDVGEALLDEAEQEQLDL